MTLKADHILLLLFLIIAGFSKIKKRDIEMDYLCIENCTVIKGFLALIVVLCHLGLFYGEGKILNCFVFLGSISVGVFFFLSGYALMLQYLTKDDYSKGFLRRRFGKVFIPYVIITFVYMGYMYFIGEGISLKETAIRFLTGEPLVSYSWYIAEIMVLYLFFYFSMMLIRNRKYVLYFNIVFYFCLMFFYQFMQYSACWCDSTHLYVIGMLWAYYKEKITKIVKEYDLFILVVSVAFLICVNTKSVIFSRIAYLFVFIVFFMRFDLRNRFLSFTGRISMEIYMLHGLAIKIVRRFFFDDDSFASLFLVLVLVYIISFAFNRIFRLFNRKLGL